MSDLYPFPNTLVGVLRSGWQLLDWLERAASCFCQITPGARLQTHWNDDFAGHAFDTILGLNYVIDLTQPARYSAEGELVNDRASRISSCSFEGAEFDPDRMFLVATNNFRAFGGGPYASAAPGDVIYRGSEKIRDLLVAHMSQDRQEAGPDPAWSFAPVAGASIALRTGPGLRGHPQKLARLGAQDQGDDRAGFARFEIPLD